ncbi:MAG TPA: class A beta-lactamase [Rhizomicrobium sp.]|nr:class A beta-lactamase [Rhizomicrobium sp.]
MTFQITRRAALAGAALLVPTYATADENLFAALEKRSGGRLGVAALDTASGRRLDYRSSERFPMCSTFKLLLVAAILQRVDRGKENLARFVKYGKSDFPAPGFYAPVTRANLAKGGMTLDALCAAAIEYSDNTAANLMLASLGGPDAVTGFARAIGDNVTRLDRNEPTLNSSVPGDPRDTTTPSAMMNDLDVIAFGRNVLSMQSSERLIGWLRGCKTADKRIRAGLPAGWTTGNKTGTGDNGSTNDVAIIWPPKRQPILVAAYYTGSTASDAAREAVLADVGRIVAKSL